MGMGSSTSVAAYPVMPNMLIGDYSPHQQANVMIPHDFTGVGRDSMQQLVTGYRQWASVGAAHLSAPAPSQWARRNPRASALSRNHEAIFKTQLCT